MMKSKRMQTCTKMNVVKRNTIMPAIQIIAMITVMTVNVIKVILTEVQTRVTAQMTRSGRYS